MLPALRPAEIPLVPGAPECALPPELTQQLPLTAPPAPWRCTFDGYGWVQRPGKAAAAVLPEPLRKDASPVLLVGAVVHYTDSPVGAYSEVFAGLLVRRGVRFLAHVPFMAVDSLHSLSGGRANWALPKTAATFTGRPATSRELSAEGEGWQVRVRAHPLGPRLPTPPARLPCAQVRPDGSVGAFPATVAGAVRVARVRVEVSSRLSLGAWMPSGAHLGVQWSQASLEVRAPLAT